MLEIKLCQQKSAKGEGLSRYNLLLIVLEIELHLMLLTELRLALAGLGIPKSCLARVQLRALL
jgi:hypothetical protein